MSNFFQEVSGKDLQNLLVPKFPNVFGVNAMCKGKKKMVTGWIIHDAKCKFLRNRKEKNDFPFLLHVVTIVLYDFSYLYVYLHFTIVLL